MIKIDHVLLATIDLQHGEQQLWRGYGLGCVAGGSHRSWGTANLIVPIGNQYLELVAVEDRDLAATNHLGRAVLAAADRDRLTPIGLCLRATDLHATAARLGQEPQPGSRLRPDGREIRWASVGLDQAFGPLRLPFFIAWEDDAEHPSAAVVEHRIGPREIAYVEVGGSEAALRQHLGTDIPEVLAVGGAPGVRSLAIRLEDGHDLQLP